MIASQFKMAPSDLKRLNPILLPFNLHNYVSSPYGVCECVCGGGGRTLIMEDGLMSLQHLG